MIYEIALKPENKKSYVKVSYNKKMILVSARKTIITQELYEKLFMEQNDNFIFYSDGIREMKVEVPKPTYKKKKIDKTILEGTISEKPKKKRKKSFLNRIRGI